MRVIAASIAVAVSFVVVLTVASAPASAVVVQFEDDDQNPHCPEVTVVSHEVEGGCPLLFESEGEVAWWLAATYVWCSLDFEVRLDETGSGYIYDQVTDTIASGNCPYEACDESGASEPWPVNVVDGGSGEYRLEVDMCVNLADVMEFNCHLPTLVLRASSHSDIELLVEGEEGFHDPCEDPVLGWLGHWTNVIDDDHPEVRFGD
jgi:hypothetical protein